MQGAPRTSLNTSVSITPQAIISNNLLQLSAADLEDAISDALATNPALDMPAPELCPSCHAALVNGACPLCTSRSRNASIRQDDDGWWNEDSRWPSRNNSFDDDEEFDPVTIIPAEATLSDYVRLQVAPLLSDEIEEEVAEFIIGSLDERGFLACDLEDVAEACHCALETVERVMRKVQTLEPAGVGARSVQECLLIQLAQMPLDDQVELAMLVVGSHWDALTRLSLDTISRQLRTPEDEIRDCIEFIGRTLNPFPANSDWKGPGPRRDTGSLHPDIIVRRRRLPEAGYEIEIPESRKYRLRVNSLYQQMVQDIRSGHCEATFGEREHLREHLAQARLFINCVRQRWQTLERIALALVDVQEGFLESGYRHLKPLTRSQLADIVGVHESTVGRAVANKTFMLPSGRIVPLSDFFDGSLSTKCVIEEIILHEDQPLSDQRIADVLQERGLDIARRTVAKYRDAIGVPPARIRGALKTRGWKPLWVPPEHAEAF